ncbi:hypothetical protein AB0K11_24725 [Mycobacterium sp. NPDC050551]|uniref:hypothetical protein n=1 Tax=Mycobacterium sp. NPDC050551 TaxID=3155407 RepID=UPI003446999D
MSQRTRDYDGDDEVWSVADEVRKQIRKSVQLEVARQQAVVARQSAAETDDAKTDRQISRDLRVAKIGGLFLVFSTAIGGSFTYASSIKPPPPPAAVTNCAEQQGRVIEIKRQNPEIDLNFSGPSDEQCHLEELEQQLDDSPP